MQSITENALITLLNQANGTNPNNESRKSATQQLISIRTSAGYPSTLLKIWQSSQPDTLREIALAQFKNHAVNNFHQTENAQEKEHCKNLLLSTYLNEKSEQCLKQISQCIAKLARKEWPKGQWSQLFNILVSNLGSDNALNVLRTATIISDILTETSSMRLPMQRTQIKKLSQQLLPVLFQIWTKAFAFAFSMFESKQNCDLNKLFQCLKLCYFLSQSIKVLIRKSHTMEFSNNSIGGQYLTKSLEVIQKLHDRYYIQLISHKNRNESPLKDIIKCINNIIKTLLLTIRDTHRQFALQFRVILPNFLSYFTHLITRHKKNKHSKISHCFLNEIIVYALLFLNDVCTLKCYEGKNVSGIQFNVGMNKVVFNQNDANECKMYVTHFFNEERLGTIIECLIGDLFILTRKDLEERKIEPCAIWQEHHIEHNNDNIRAAAKQLFKSLVKKYTRTAAPIIVEMFKSITSAKNVPNMSKYQSLDPMNEMYTHFFLKEAVYLALGLKYFDISLYLNQLGCAFGTIGEILGRDLKAYGFESGYKLPFLSTRIIWLFGKLKEDINKDKNTKQYVYNSILQHLQPIKCKNLQNDTDLENEVLLLRLDSAEALYRLLDDNGFECKEFNHILQTTFELLLQLVSDCDSSLECMQDILRYICCVIKQNCQTLALESNESIVNSIFASMGQCWDQCSSTETNLCRVNLLECLTHLIGCMKSSNIHKLYNRLLPMISFCTETVDDDSRMCLIESGLELWHKTLYHSYVLSDEMQKLFRLNWIPQMQSNSDYFDTLMAILKSYLFLGGGAFVQNYASDIEQCLSQIVPDMSGLDDSFSKVTDVLCVFVQLFPEQSPHFLRKILEYLSGDFMRIMNGQNAQNMASNLQIECYMLLFCRLLLANTEGTLKVFESIGNNNNLYIKQLFQCMFSAKSKVKQYYKQKIVALGLLKIFCGISASNNESNNSVIIQLLSELLPWWVYVIAETEIDTLEFAEDMHPEINEDNKEEWTEADRIANLYCNDLVSHTFMIEIVMKTLKESAQKSNVSMDSLLQQIQSAQSMNNANNNVVQDFQKCVHKYNEYLKNKENEND